MVTTATDVGNTFTALANGVILKIINVIVLFFQQNLLYILLTGACIMMVLDFVILAQVMAGIKRKRNFNSAAKQVFRKDSNTFFMIETDSAKRRNIGNNWF